VKKMAVREEKGQPDLDKRGKEKGGHYEWNVRGKKQEVCFENIKGGGEGQSATGGRGF